MGKHKPTQWGGADSGDWVVVTNAKEAVLTGDKAKSKLYKWHTGWMGGLKTLTARQVHERAPERIIEHAVKGMMPPNRLRDGWMKRLRVFPGTEHPHAAQVAASQKSSAAFLTAAAPRKFSPPPAKVTGNLVSNYYGAAPDGVPLTTGAAPLVAEDRAAALVALKAELARRAAAVDVAKAAAAAPLK